MELLDCQVPEPGPEQGGHIGGIPNPGLRWPLFLQDAGRQFKGRKQSGRLGRPDPTRPGQLGWRPRGKAPQRSPASLEKRIGDLPRRHPRVSRP